MQSPSVRSSGRHPRTAATETFPTLGLPRAAEHLSLAHFVNDRISVSERSFRTCNSIVATSSASLATKLCPEECTGPVRLVVRPRGNVSCQKRGAGRWTMSGCRSICPARTSNPVGGSVNGGIQYKGGMPCGKFAPLSWLAGTSPSDLQNQAVPALELSAVVFSLERQQWDKQWRMSRLFPTLI